MKKDLLVLWFLNSHYLSGKKGTDFTLSTLTSRVDSIHNFQGIKNKNQHHHKYHTISALTDVDVIIYKIILKLEKIFINSKIKLMKFRKTQPIRNNTDFILRPKFRGI